MSRKDNRYLKSYEYYMMKVFTTNKGLRIDR